jgi:molybdopterin/thiamine biosynthesis adenylyltransferase
MDTDEDEIDFLRQLDMLSPRDLDGVEVTVVGAGGIGSFTIPALAKMGVTNLTIYDDDVVEPHNLPNQSYRPQDLGHSKVEAIASICGDFTKVRPNAVASKLGSIRPEGIVISGVDSMRSRKAIWKNISWNPNVRCYIDARMGAEMLQIFTIDPCDEEQVIFYEKSLFDDKNAFVAPCTNRAIIYTGYFVAAFICNQLKKVVKEEKVIKEIIFDCRKTPTLLMR